MFAERSCLKWVPAKKGGCTDFVASRDLLFRLLAAISVHRHLWDITQIWKGWYRDHWSKMECLCSSNRHLVFSIYDTRQAGCPTPFRLSSSDKNKSSGRGYSLSCLDGLRPSQRAPESEAGVRETTGDTLGCLLTLQEVSGQGLGLLKVPAQWIPAHPYQLWGCVGPKSIWMVNLSNKGITPFDLFALILLCDLYITALLYSNTG